ncbi:MAG: tRNA-dihydrouridine synthase family protein [Treponema sp.]|nr:tRNA-dihydrouridine synthase family protein [Treponema sp.]
MKLICGPMATISHPAFRILVEKFGGCDEYYTEMINAGTLLTGGPFEKYYIDPAPVPQKLVWQLTGKSSELMIEAAKMLVKLPGLGLDLNMGCSAPDIYRYGAGISWMTKPREETLEMVRGVSRVVNEYEGEKKRLSVKLRLGDEDFTEEGFFSFCDMLVKEGVELLTLHPRTKKEKLTRTPRYSYCQQLAERYKCSSASSAQEKSVAVYLNGNVKDMASYDYAVAAAPSVDGVMISRAAVQKPWIFRELKGDVDFKTVSEPEKVDLQELALSYIDDVEKYQPPEFWKTRLQRFFTYFSQNFKFAHYAQTQFLNAADNNDLRTRVVDFFAKCPGERFLEL